MICDHRNDGDDGDDVAFLMAAADKIDAWADTAELMGDDYQAAKFREKAGLARERAMQLLDD